MCAEVVLKLNHPSGAPTKIRGLLYNDDLNMRGEPMPSRPTIRENSTECSDASCDATSNMLTNQPWSRHTCMTAPATSPIDARHASPRAHSAGSVTPSSSAKSASRRAAG